MPEYIIRNDSGQFVARVLAESPEDAIHVLYNRMGDMSVEAIGEVVYVDFESASVSITQALDPANPLQGFQVSENDESKQLKLKGEVCVYCGQDVCKSEQGDHVVARGFFDEAKRNNTVVYIRVPACETCNGMKSKGETYMIPLLSLNAGPDNPDSASITAFEGPVYRSISKVPDIWRNLLKGAQTVFVPSDDGTHLLETVAVDAKWSLADSVLQMITKGLYFFHTGMRFPDTHEVIVSCATSDTISKYEEFMLNSDHTGPISLGDGVFNYMFIRLADDAISSIWLMSFYGHYHVVAKALTLKKPGQVLQVKQELPFAKAGLYLLRTYCDNKAELSCAELHDGHVVTTGTRITVSRNQLVLFQPTNIAVDL